MKQEQTARPRSQLQCEVKEAGKHDGMIINRRRAMNPERFSTTPPLFTPSRPSSTMSSHSEPLLRNVGHRQNIRIILNH